MITGQLLCKSNLAATYSAGVLCISPEKLILLGKATGSARWDIPKGRPDEGESPIQAAVRELQEETGLVVKEVELLELGRFAYLPKKDLHLFVWNRPACEKSQLVCESTFADHRTGEIIPEFCDFGWFEFDQAYQLTGKSLSVLLKELLPGL